MPFKDHGPIAVLPGVSLSHSRYNLIISRSAGKAGEHQKGNKSDARFEIAPDYEALGVNGAKRTKITDLLTGKTTTKKPSDPRSFTAVIPAEHLGLYLAESD